MLSPNINNNLSFSNSLRNSVENSQDSILEPLANQSTKSSNISFISSTNDIKENSGIFDGLKNIINKVKKVFILYVIIKPAIKKYITQQIKDIGPKDYKKNYIQFTVSSQNLFKHLKTKYKSLSLFSDKFLRETFETKLVYQVNKKLKENELPLITKNEMEKASYENNLHSLFEIKSPVILAKELLAIPSHRMPISSLAKIELTSENKDVLINTWRRVLNDLPEIGSLNELESPYFNKKSLVRIDCATKILEILHLAPKSIDPKLDKLINNYSPEKIDKLENFIIHENSMLKYPVELELTHLKEKQEIYQSKIQPEIDQLINNLMTPLDSSELVKILSGSKLNDAMNYLSFDLEAPQTLFTKESLKKIILKQTEIMALTVYGFTLTQIENMKSIRTSGEIEDNYLAEHQALYGKNVIENIQKFGYSHPSKISPNSMIDLLKISEIFFLNKNQYVTTDEQNQEFMSALENLSKNPDIEKILKKFNKAEKSKIEKKEKSLTPGLIGVAVRLWKKFRPSQIKESYKIPAGISKEAMNLISKYIEMQKKHAKIVEILPKSQALLDKYQTTPDQIKPSDRLTLKDLGSLYALSDFSKSLDIFKDLGLQTHSMISNFYSTSLQASNIRNEIEKVLLPAFSKHYSSGDFILYYGKRKAQWKGSEGLSMVDKLINIFLGGKTHGMKVYHDGDILRGSEISKAYENTEMRVYDIAISDGWRLKLENLVTRTTKEHLEQIMGNNWKDVLKKAYESIEDEIHGKKSKNFEGIENSMNRKVRAGLANWKWLTKILKPVTWLNIKGHLKKYEQDFRKVHKTFMSQSKVKEFQICSEFASKSTLAAIIELNKKLTEFIGERKPHFKGKYILEDLTKKNVNLPEDVVSYLNGEIKFGKERFITKNALLKLKNILKVQGYNDKDIDLIIRLNNEEIINLPYDRREKMKTINPGRMISILKKKKCVTKIAKPKEFNMLIQV